MKSKKLKILLWGIVLAMTLGAFLIHFISILVAYSQMWAQVLLYTFLGLVITAFFAPLFLNLCLNKFILRNAG